MQSFLQRNLVRRAIFRSRDLSEMLSPP